MPTRSTTRLRREPTRFRALGWALACAWALGLPAGCRCTAQASAYARTSFETPRQSLDSFILFWSAGLHDLEYRCFSQGFRREHQLSLLSYSAGRSELERAHPWLAWFAKARVVAEHEMGKAQHGFEVEVAGRTVRVNLVREETVGIWSRGELVAEGALDLARAVELTPAGAGRVEFALHGRADDLDSRALAEHGVTRVVAEQAWKIDSFFELQP